MRPFAGRMLPSVLCIAVCGLFAFSAHASSAGNRIKVSLADSPDVPPASIEKGKMYDIQWGNQGQTVSVRWTEKGEIELIGIVGDFSMSIAIGKQAVSARVREAGRVRISNMSGVEVRLTPNGPAFSLKTVGEQFEIRYDVYDTRPGETHFYEVYALRLQMQPDPQSGGETAENDKEKKPDFFLPSGRSISISASSSSEGIVIKFTQQSEMEQVTAPETDKTQQSIVLGGRPSEE